MSYQTDLHTPDCQAAVARFREERAVYLSRWPQACKLCYATGNVWLMQAEEDDLCEDCLGAEKCPRCGEDFHYTDAHSRCPHCGWEMFEDVMPMPPECDCFGEVSRLLEDI